MVPIQGEKGEGYGIEAGTQTHAAGSVIMGRCPHITVVKCTMQKQ